MELIMTANLHYLNLEDSKRTFDLQLGFGISANQELLDKFINKEYFILNLGINKFGTYVNSPFIFFAGEDSELFEQHGVSNIIELADSFHGRFQQFLFCLWLVEDNSINLNGVDIQIPSTGQTITNNKSIIFSNSRGEYLTHSLREETLNKTTEIMDVLFAILGGRRDDQGSPIHISQVPYNEHDRLDRAILFIYLARSQSLLPLKISFYIACLESLFTTDSAEVTHKVSERATRLLSGDLDTKKENFKTIKNAYTVRSKYVHGQSLGNSYRMLETLSDLSMKIDTIVRAVLYKLIKDHATTFQFNNEQLESWFTELILE